MAVESKDVVARFPELRAIKSVDFDAAFAEAERNVCRENFGARADDATLYLAAHLTILWDRGNDVQGGPVSSVKLGDGEVRYAVSQSAEPDDLGSTVYGRRFKALSKKIFSARVLP